METQIKAGIKNVKQFQRWNATADELYNTFLKSYHCKVHISQLGQELLVHWFSSELCCEMMTEQGFIPFFVLCELQLG